jgi:hypothetical protein
MGLSWVLRFPAELTAEIRNSFERRCEGVALPVAQSGVTLAGGRRAVAWTGFLA